VENKSIPEIRFSEFSGDWEEIKLSDVLKERKVKQKISEEAPLLAFAAGQGVIDRSERKTNNRDFLTNDSTEKSYLITKLNDIVYNPSNLKYGAIDRNKHGYGVISPIYVTFETNEIPSFIELIVKSNAFKQRALRYEEGTVTKRQSVKPENLLSLNVVLPNSKNEQIEIGNLFEELEDIITINKQELENLKQTKQGFLQKMFPKKGESVPEIRFPGFNEDWEQRKLGDVADIIGGGTPSTSNKEYWNGDIDWYSPVEIGDQTYVENSQRKITELGLQKSSAKILPVGTVLFTSRAGIGKTAILANEGATNQGFQSIVPHKEELNSYFIYSKTNELKRYGETHGAGSTFVEVSGKQMVKMPMLIPTLEEQQKIGNFFKQLDYTIALHEQELETLKQTKRAFLQKMFI